MRVERALVRDERVELRCDVGRRLDEPADGHPRHEQVVAVADRRRARVAVDVVGQGERGGLGGRDGVERVTEGRGVFGLVADPGEVGHAPQRDDVVAADDGHVGETRIGRLDRPKDTGDLGRDRVGRGHAAWVGIPGVVGGPDARVGVDRDDGRDDAERGLACRYDTRLARWLAMPSAAAWPYVATIRLWFVRNTVLASAGMGGIAGMGASRSGRSVTGRRPHPSGSRPGRAGDMARWRSRRCSRSRR